jgi:zinc protease
MLSVCFAFRCGSAYDPTGKEGRGMLYTRLFLEGRADWPSSTFMKQLSLLGASVNVVIDQDYIVFTSLFPAEHADQVMGTLKKLLRATNFDREDFERCRDYLPGDVQITYTPAHVLGIKALMSRLLPNHPYGRSMNGTPEGIQAITLQDLHNYATTDFTRDRLVVSVAGNCHSGSVKKLVEAFFDDLPEKSSLKPLPPLPATTPGQQVVIPKRTTQTLIMFGQRGVNATHKDWIAWVLINHILGGDMTSRLFLKLRDEQSLTYDVQTSIMDQESGSVLVGSLQTEAKQVDAVIKTLKDQWEHIYRHGITARELADAKSYMIGQLATRMVDSFGIARVMLQLQMRGYAPSYFSERERVIQAVTLEDVNRLIRSILLPENLTLVIVGQKDA